MVKIELSCRRELDLDIFSIQKMTFFAKAENAISGFSCRRELDFDDFFNKKEKSSSVCEMSIFEGCLS